jgi:hypothetical protein
MTVEQRTRLGFDPLVTQAILFYDAIVGKHPERADTPYDNYGSLKEKREENPGFLEVVQIALAQELGFAGVEDVLLDWGIGEAPYYPLSYVRAKIRGVEVNRQAVVQAYREGRIGKEVLRTLETTPTPPYRNIDAESVTGVMGVSSFHILREPNFEELLHEFKRVLKTGGKICHVQNMVPGENFLYGLSAQTWQKILYELKTRYPGLAFSLKGNPSQETFWANYLSDYRQNLEERSILFSPTADRQSVPKGLIQDVPINLQSAIGRIAAYSGKPTKEINGLLKVGDGQGIAGIFEVGARLLALANETTFRQGTFELIKNILLVDFVITTLLEEIFEIYLTIKLTEAGIETESSVIMYHLPGLPIKEPFAQDRTGIVFPEEGRGKVSIARVVSGIVG